MTAPSLVVDGHFDGRVHGERDGAPFAFDGPKLAKMRRQIHGWHDAIARVGNRNVRFDEADVNLLVAVLTEPEADKCHWCPEPGFEIADYQPACHGHAMAYAHAEEAS